MDRRSFVKNSVLMSGTILFSPNISFSPNEGLRNIGLQLYTVREDVKTDLKSTLKQIRKIGYTHVEGANYKDGKFYDISPKEFFKILNGTGLKMHSTHIKTGFGAPAGTANMRNDFEKVCADAKSINVKYLVSDSLLPEERQTIDDYKSLADLFNKCGEIAKKYGIQLCHHNHDFEFFPIDGIVPYDILLKETEKDLLKFELDHYWTQKAGVDTIKLIKKNKGRFPLFHIKDMDNTPEQNFTEVGTGVINWKKIFATSKNAGMMHFYIEQDKTFGKSAMESISESFNNLKKMPLKF